MVTPDKTSSEKKSLLLDFFSTHQLKPKGRPELKTKSESKNESAKVSAGVKQKKLTAWGIQPLSVSQGISDQKDRTEEVGFTTHTKEISFDDFLKFRLDKKITK